ncbi:MAG TPA: hypothetical protein EYP85_14545 [Armatimonadetes bacterium]|nr:hypothetical protein [Armatimonadota bacterium]
MVFKPSSTRTPRAQSPIRLRAVVLALLLMPLNSYWVGFMEAIKYTGHPTTYSLYFNTVFILAVLVLLNLGVRRVWPRVALSRAELLVVYFMLCVGSALVGHDQAQVLLSVVGHPYYFDTPEKGWKALFFRYLPHWLLVTDVGALEKLYAGNSTLWTGEHLRAWLKPLLWWAAFTWVLLGTMFCLSVVFRRPWVEREKLTFPLVALPVEMTQAGVSFYRSNLMWMAFLIPTFINLLNNLHVFYPAVPSIGIRTIDLRRYLVTRPWNALGWTPVWFFPFAIGIGFLLPLDLLFSSWFFYWFWKSEKVLAALFGFSDEHPHAPYIPEQSFGAYIGIALIVLWSARGQLREVGREALSRRQPSAAREPFSYRLAVFGFACGLAWLVWFSVRMGMSLLPAVAFMILYLMISLTISRLRAEFGSPVHDLHFADPGYVMTQVFSPLAFTPRTLVGFTLYFWFNRAHRSHPMPFQLESLVAAQRVGGSSRRMALALVIAILAGTFIAYWALLQPYYVLGAASGKVAGAQRGFAARPFNQLASWLQMPPDPDPIAAAFMAGGLSFTLLLFGVRIRLVGFPFHPVGYAVSGTWSMELVWMPLFLAWLCKRLIIRYGGLRLYRRAVPFFLGLILGDFVSGAIWNILGVIYDWPVYHFLG